MSLNTSPQDMKRLCQPSSGQPPVSPRVIPGTSSKPETQACTVYWQKWRTDRLKLERIDLERLDIVLSAVFDRSFFRQSGSVLILVLLALSYFPASIRPC